jgi:hypothetical protein
MDQVTITLSADEARIVVAALRQFEPYWPADIDERDLADLLHVVQRAVGRVTADLAACAAG